MSASTHTATRKVMKSYSTGTAGRTPHVNMELLVQVKDSLRPLEAKRGDVVVAMPDGWAWGECELGGPTYTDENGQKQPIANHINGNHNFWRILKLPNISQPVVSQLTSTEKDVDPLHPSANLQFRGFYIDLDNIPVANLSLITYLADDTRASRFLTSPLTDNQLQSIILQRPALPFVPLPVPHFLNNLT